MAYKYDILLGRIIKISGYEGAVAVKLEKVFIENIPEMESVFLEIEGRPVPFFISGNEYTGADILKLRFEDYESIEKINEFVGCSVYLTTGMAVMDKKKATKNIIGYSVLDQEKNPLGEVSELISNSGQWLLNVISADNKDILIPFHEDLIISIDKKKQIIVMNIPEGLKEIN